LNRQIKEEMSERLRTIERCQDSLIDLDDIWPNRRGVPPTAATADQADATAAILLARFTSRPIPEICAMGGIALEDFTQSVAYREIFGLGEQRGRQQGLQAGELDITLRLLRLRCGGLSPEQESRIRALPLPRLEALAEALLDFQGPDDLKAWLAGG
jgi:hypothetical protein